MTPSDPLPPLTPTQRARVTQATATCRALYDGVITPHRSCGIALAETFTLPTAPFQALRRGGITGHGECGAIVAGRLILGHLLGDPDPTGAVTPALAAAMPTYEALWHARVDRGEAPGQDIVCRTLTGPFAEFTGPARHAFCTDLAATAAACAAEALVRHGWTGPVADTPT